MAEPFLIRVRSAVLVAVVVGAMAAVMSWGQHLPVPGEQQMASLEALPH
jgi:hypothetical protein